MPVRLMVPRGGAQQACKDKGLSAWCGEVATKGFQWLRWEPSRTRSAVLRHPAPSRAVGMGVRHG